ncbi:metacaspase 2 [Zostera marina]|uniref:Metacaspase 2 n=1 Tax=Zostera marina TaxID=29655 RepID=A0A0K9P028_ZOSMR|nr:metacaspase 2 [Zostera marina]
MAQCSSSGRKKAVICGISYKGCDDEIEGSVNDAMFVKYLLKNKYNFSNIFMLTEDETNFLKIPTRRNIMIAMKWLVKDCQAGDSLVFFYSGHGVQEKDMDGDEIDGLDEAICPLDYATEGMITDDEINETIVRPLPTGVKLHAIIDSCHSGTMLDLRYLCKMNRKGDYYWEDQRSKNSVWKGTMGGEVFAFSGCDDNQQSTDTKVKSAFN